MKARRATGFTLVEMLVAITIMAVLGLIAWRGLDQLIAQRTRLDDSTGDTEQVVRTLSQFERDITQRVPDALISGRTLPGSPLPFAIDVDTDTDGKARIRVRRARSGGGTSNVLWSVERGTLVRTASTTNASGADRVALLAAVSGVGVRVLLAGGWVDARNLVRTTATLPERGAAIEFSIERGAAGRFVRVLAL